MSEVIKYTSLQKDALLCPFSNPTSLFEVRRKTKTKTKTKQMERTYKIKTKQQLISPSNLQVTLEISSSILISLCEQVLLKSIWDFITCLIPKKTRF